MSVKVGMALYSVRKEMNLDPIETIRQVGKIGYKYIEAANYNLDQNSFLGFDITPAEFNDIMQEFGMKLINCHVSRIDDYYVKGSCTELNDFPRVQDLTDDDIRRLAEQHLQAGNQYLCAPITYFPNDVDGILRRCEYLDHICTVAEQCGMKFVYHSHFQEFVKIGDKFVLDYICENSRVLLEMDTYWAMRSGEDPVEMLKRFGSRTIFVHQKDYPKCCPIPVNIWRCLGTDMKTGKYPTRWVRDREFFLCDNPETFAEIGTGIMPIQKIIDAVNQYTKASYIILEQDHSSFNDEYLSAQVSMANFKTYSGIEW